MTNGHAVVAPANGASMTDVMGHAIPGNLATGEKIVTASMGDGDGSYLVAPGILTLTVLRVRRRACTRVRRRSR